MTYRKSVVVLVAYLSIILAGCSDDSARPGATIEGVWGAEHHELVASSDGVRLEYDCAHGAIEGTLVLDSAGTFDVLGTHTREGGPIDLNDPPESLVARYQGRLMGDRLELTVTITDTGDVIGPFTVVRGERGVLRKCL